MAQPFNGAVLTDAGAALITKAQAGQIRLKFVKMAVGNGAYSDSEKTVDSLKKRTSLKSLKNEYALSQIYVRDEHTVKLTSLITNQDPVTKKGLVTSGYYINEIGLYAKADGAPDSTAILYSIAVTSGPNGDFMPPYSGLSPAEIIQDYYATVNNSASVTINVDGAALPASRANRIMDDSTQATFKIGIDGGKLYIEEVDD